MQEQIKTKYYEIMQKLESQPLPFSVELKDLSFKQAEELRYELCRKDLRVEIYEEFKVLYLGIYER